MNKFVKLSLSSILILAALPDCAPAKRSPVARNAPNVLATSQNRQNTQGQQNQTNNGVNTNTPVATTAGAITPAASTTGTTSVTPQTTTVTNSTSVTTTQAADDKTKASQTPVAVEINLSNITDVHILALGQMPDSATILGVTVEVDQTGQKPAMISLDQALDDSGNNQKDSSGRILLTSNDNPIKATGVCADKSFDPAQGASACNDVIVSVNGKAKDSSGADKSVGLAIELKSRLSVPVTANLSTAQADGSLKVDETVPFGATDISRVSIKAVDSAGAPISSVVAKNIIDFNVTSSITDDNSKPVTANIVGSDSNKIINAVINMFPYAGLKDGDSKLDPASSSLTYDSKVKSLNMVVNTDKGAKTLSLVLNPSTTGSDGGAPTAAAPKTKQVTPPPANQQQTPPPAGTGKQTPPPPSPGKGVQTGSQSPAGKDLSSLYDAANEDCDDDDTACKQAKALAQQQQQQRQAPPTAGGTGQQTPPAAGTGKQTQQPPPKPTKPGTGSQEESQAPIQG